MPTAIALVDVNNFYASSERLFRSAPTSRVADRRALQQRWLRGCPTGAEAKLLGVKMGALYFQIRELY